MSYGNCGRTGFTEAKESFAVGFSRMRASSWEFGDRRLWIHISFGVSISCSPSQLPADGPGVVLQLNERVLKHVLRTPHNYSHRVGMLFSQGSIHSL